MFKILLNLLVMLIGAAFMGLAYFYWVTPAGALPPQMPGYIEGAAKIHYKHAIASLLLGLAAFAFAWFVSGSGKKKPPQTPDNLTAEDTLKL